MNRSVLIGLACCLGLLGCTQAGGGTTTVTAAPAQPATTEAPIDRWDALRPDEVTYQRPPPQIGLSRNGMDGVGGLIDDTGSGTPPGQEIDHSSPDRAKQFGSSQVVETADGRAVDLDGYVVPLGTNDAGLVDELLFVPFYGACIHVPPPPPNQLVLVRYPKGLKIDDIYTPLWVSGKLKVEKVSNDLADAAYALDAGKVRVVEDADL